MSPVVVHRAEPGRELRRVTHRASGRYLGLVGQHDRDAEGLGGLWSAWGPFDEGSEEAVAEPRQTMSEACNGHLRDFAHTASFRVGSAEIGRQLQAALRA